MPFLSRRRSQQVARPEHLEERNDSIVTSTHSPPPKDGTSSLLIRVSTLFSRRRTRQRTVSELKSRPLSIISFKFDSTPESNLFSRSSSISSPPPSPDIRRPSGLGRRASLLECERSSEDLQYATEGIYDQRRSISSPAIYYTGGGIIGNAGMKTLEVQPSLSRFDMPLEILEVIVSHLPRSVLPSTARINRAFCSVSRNMLYRTLDFRRLHEVVAEDLLFVLSRKVYLAALVRTFHCLRWPTAGSRILEDGSLSSPSFTSTLCIAMRNMRNLTTLTLPSFFTAVLHPHHTPFQLRNLTLLNQSFSSAEQYGFLSWLAGQRELCTLSLPVLADSGDFAPYNPPAFLSPHPNIASDDLPAYSSLPSPNSQQAPDIVRDRSPYFLPSLQVLHGPPSLVMALASSIQHTLCRVDTHIRTTIFAGLRPSTLLKALRGVEHLKLKFGQQVDTRTVEKMLSVAGTVLTQGGDRSDGGDGGIPKSLLQVLEVEVTWLDDTAAEILCRLIHSALPRFRGLRKLKLSAPCCQSAISTPSSLPYSFPLPPTLGRNSLSSRPPSLCLSTLSSLGAAQEGQIPEEETDEIHIQAWSKQCPSLSDIVFPSGSQWILQVRSASATGNETDESAVAAWIRMDDGSERMWDI